MKKCQICDKIIDDSECHEYENYECLCDDCYNEQNELDDFPVFF